MQSPLPGLNGNYEFVITWVIFRKTKPKVGKECNDKKKKYTDNKYLI